MKKLSTTKCERVCIETEHLILTVPSEENILEPIHIKIRNNSIDFIPNDLGDSNIENIFEERKTWSNKQSSASSLNPPFCFPILDKQKHCHKCIFYIHYIYINIYIYIYSPVDPLDLKEIFRRRKYSMEEETQSMRIINEANSVGKYR